MLPVYIKYIFFLKKYLEASTAIETPPKMINDELIRMVVIVDEIASAQGLEQEIKELLKQDLHGQRAYLDLRIFTLVDEALRDMQGTKTDFLVVGYNQKDDPQYKAPQNGLDVLLKIAERKPQVYQTALWYIGQQTEVADNVKYLDLLGITHQLRGEWEASYTLADEISLLIWEGPKKPTRKTRSKKVLVLGNGNVSAYQQALGDSSSNIQFSYFAVPVRSSETKDQELMARNAREFRELLSRQQPDVILVDGDSFPLVLGTYLQDFPYSNRIIPTDSSRLGDSQYLDNLVRRVQES